MQYRKGMRAVAAGALLSAFATAAWAADHVEQLEAVEVRGEPAERQLSEELADYGNRVEIVERERISASGAVDIAQALQMLAPGLHLAPSAVSAITRG